MSELFKNLQAVVQYRRKDGGHGWIAMAAYDTEHAAQRYAFKCGRDNSENWPWEYRALDYAGDVLPPLDDEEQVRLAVAYRLHDAASDLLEALSGLLEGVYGDGYCLPAGAIATRKARAAIAKATDEALSARPIFRGRVP